MRLAVDVMGGDHAPDAILKGCLDALPVLDADDRLVLVGDRREIAEVLRERGQWAASSAGSNGAASGPGGGPKDPRLEIEHASEVIGMDDPPVDAVRTKVDSSIVRMAHLGSRKAPPGKRCDVVLSAGNTGACVSAATMHMRRLDGVHRPGIAVPIPGFHGPIVLSDAGANPEPRPSHLWQYGVMAETLARVVLKVDRPRVAVLNIGSEEGKGTELIRKTHELCKSTPGMNYIGFIEGRDFFDGVADVIISDGFVGNTVLKVAEGLARSLVQNLVGELLQHDPQLAVTLEPVFRAMYAKKDYHEYGGAPLLGVNGVCVIAHGSSEARTVVSAIRNCKRYFNAGLNEAIVRRLGEVAHAGALTGRGEGQGAGEDAGVA